MEAADWLWTPLKKKQKRRIKSCRRRISAFTQRYLQPLYMSKHSHKVKLKKENHLKLRSTEEKFKKLLKSD